MQTTAISYHKSFTIPVNYEGLWKKLDTYVPNNINPYKVDMATCEGCIAMASVDKPTCRV